MSVLPVDPGSEISTDITVRNTGTVVDQFRCEVVGDAAGWATVEPAVVSLFPGGESTVTVRFRPPRSPNVPAGPMAFGVKITPEEDLAGSAVEEGTLEIGSFTETTAELLPRTSRGRRRGLHDLAIDNRGNVKLNAEVTAVDPDDQLEFKVDPPSVVILPGAAAFAKVRVAPRKRFWRGPPQTRMFQVYVQPEVGQPVTCDGTMLQEPILPKWLLRAVIAALLILALLIGIWFRFIRPTLESAARQAAQEEVAEVAEKAEAAEEAAAQAGEQASAAQGQAEEAQAQSQATEEQVQEVVEQGAAAAVARDLGGPRDLRLTRSVVAGASAESAFVVEPDKQLSITDIVLQNPNGDRGLVEVRRRVGGTTTTLLQVRLENFRDLDYHFVTPVVFRPGEALILFIRCENQPPEEGAPAPACNPSAYFTGAEKDLSADTAP